MEANNNKDIAELISKGTKEEVEASGQKYEPIDFSEEPQPTDEERSQLSEKVVGQVEDGKVEKIKENEEYVKTYGGKPGSVFW